MAGLGDRDMDKLVDVIAQRVEQEIARRRSTRLPVAPPAEGAVAPCGSCAASGQCDSGRVVDTINAGAARLSTSGSVEAAPCGHVAPLIDHTLLKPDATKEELRKVCEEARRFGFATVCVNSANIRYVSAQLAGSGTKPIAVVGFPLGAATSGAKAFETKEAIRNGAEEIDMVLNVGLLKSRDYAGVLADIQTVVEAAGKKPVKVILETSLLDRDQKVVACALAKAAGAAFVKTSTGFGGGGATAEDIALMRSVVGEEMGVKASGGVRTIDDAQRFIAAGASRIGASSSVGIVQCVRPTPGKSEPKKAY